ncbi:MAG: hypothetical protein EHM56_13855 [Chloroflexi bacterium]|nr:MAG: hypothetical protein EHM56_13855 [Chloroflexota bacterium]
MDRVSDKVRTWRRLAALLVVLTLALTACGPAAGTEPEGTADPNLALLTWHREGGLAGFCDELSVMGDGRVVVNTCRGGEDTILGEGTLTPDQQAQLEEWVSRFTAVDIEQTDPATADAMTVRLALAGRGSAEATEQELQAIRDYVASLYLDIGRLPEGPTPTPEVFQPLPPEERVFAAARAALAARLGIDELTITRQEIVRQDWTDSCLGLGGPAESCLQAITPGYRLVLQAGEELWEARTNLDGSVVRLVEMAQS